MSVYTRSSVLLSTLALVSAGLTPALAANNETPPVATPVSSQGDAPACPNRFRPTIIEADGVTKTLETAIQEATHVLAQCADNEQSVTIALTGEGPYTLPNEINANGSIRVQSRLSDDRLARIVQTQQQPIEVYSTLELRRIHWVGNSRGFTVHHRFYIYNSLIEYGGNGDPNDPSRYLIRLENTVPPPSPGEATDITISESTFTNFGIGEFGDIGFLQFNDNTVNFDGQHFPALILRDRGYLENQHDISDNVFTAVNHHANAIIQVQDQRAWILRNQFDVQFDPSVGDASVKAAVLLRSDQQLTDGFKTIQIQENRFVQGPGVDWIEDEGAAPSDPGMVLVNRNDLSKSEVVFTRPLNANQLQAISASCNFWGDLDRRKVQASGVERVLTSGDDLADGGCEEVPLPPAPPAASEEHQGQPAPEPQQPPAPVPPAPVPSPQPTEDPVLPKEIKEDAQESVEIDQSGLRLAGLTRFETAVEAAQHRFAAPQQGQDAKQTVIVARGDVAADSVAAVPLAKALNAPILLTPPHQAHASMIEEIRRLVKGSGEVILMGGEHAISPTVAQTIAELGLPVSRVDGANRADTAVKTAERLEGMGKLESVYLVDGQDWQPALITGPVAAKTTGVTLLTNGEALAPETKAFLADHPTVSITAIGDNAASAGAAARHVVGRDGTELSLKVARAFFSATDRIGIATSADFADALIGGGHIGQEGGALVLTNGRNATRVNAYLKTQPSITKLYVYGGTERIGVASELPN